MGKTMRDVVELIEKGKFEETEKIKALKANLVVGNRVTMAGEVLVVNVWEAKRLVNDGVAASAE
jgi:hypothetical protein